MVGRGRDIERKRGREGDGGKGPGGEWVAAPSKERWGKPERD